MSLPLRIDNLTKTYKIRGGARTAVDSLSLDVQPGVIFGFLGPNGAGKTTTIKTALDFIRSTSGRIELFGLPSTDFRARERVGYVPEQPYFHKFLKPAEVMSIHTALAGVPAREATSVGRLAMERARIAEYADTPISKLSKGLTQRVSIAQSLVGNPDLLILDEPTSGLDPVGRRHIRDLLIELRSEGKTIFMSSHLLSEVEQVCDAIAVLRQGRLVYCGKPEDAKTEGSKLVVRTSAVTASDCERLAYLNLQIEQSNGETVFTVEPSDVYALMHALEQAGASVLSIETLKESIEEAFLRLAA